MKKQVLSWAMTAALLASAAPNSVMIPNVSAEDETSGETVKFEENLYYNDFSKNMDGLTEIKNDKKDTVSVSDGKLVIDQQTTAFQSYVDLAIDGSEDWEEYTFETTAQITGAPGYLYFYTKYGSGETPYRYMINTNGRMTKENEKQEYVSAPFNNQYAFKHRIDVTATGSKYRYWAESQFTSWDNITEGWNPQTYTEGQSGKIVLSARWSTAPTYIDEIKVTDLRAKAAVTSNTKNLEAGDMVTVKFSEAMSTETLKAENFYLTDGTNTVAVKNVTVNGDDEVAVAIPDEVEDGVTYTLVAKKEIKDASGDRMNNDKKFEVKIAGETVTFEENLYYNDFSKNMDGLTQVWNDRAADTVSVEDGQLKFNLTDTYSRMGYSIDGSEGWEEYNVLIKSKIENGAGSPYTRMQFYPRYENADSASYEWFIKADSNTVYSPGDVSVGQSWFNIINNGMYTKINVNKNTSHYYSYPLLATTTEAILDNGLAEKASDTKYNKTHTASDKPFVINAKWASKTIWVDEIKVVDLRAKAALASDAQALEPGDKITVKFSEAMDTSKFTTENVYFKNGEETIAAANVSASGNKKMIVTVPEDLLSGEDYTLVVKKEITDASGDRMNTDKTFAVKTAKAKFNILSVSPEHGAENVNVLSDITISFDDVINYESDINLKITDDDGKPVAHKISLAQSTEKRMYIAFDKELEPATTYHVEISKVKSTAGYMISGVKKFSFKTADAGADYLYTNDFSDPATISDFDISKKANTETVTIEDGVLKIDTTNLDGGKNSSFDVSARIIGSEKWSDYEVEMDIKGVTDYQFPYVSVRGGTLTNTLTSVSDDLKISLDGFETKSLGKTAFTNFHQNAKKLVIRAEGNNFTVTYDGTVIHQGENDSVDAKGAITLGSKWYGSVAIDNLKVKDLGISAHVTNPKNLSEGDEVFVEFDRAMNTDTLTEDDISVKAEDGTPLKVSVRVKDEKTVAIKLPYGIASNEKYIITLGTEIASKDGIYLATEKKLEIKAAEKDFHVGSLELISNDKKAEGLEKSAEIKAQAFFKNSSKDTQTAVLVLAVYDADGRCVAVKTADVSLAAGEDDTIETKTYTLPTDIKGYSARIMCVDSIQNIKPLITSREY